MYVLILILFIIILYTFIKIIDACVFPLLYCINGDRDLDDIEFNTYIPYKKDKI